MLGRPLFPDYETFSSNYYRVAEGGNWTVPELVKYLVFFQSTKQQQPINVKRFSRIPAFSKEATAEQEDNEDGTPKKFRASNLYQPLDIFRDLGLPIIDWQGKDGKCKWRSNSKEGIPNIVWTSLFADTTIIQQSYCSNWG